MDKNEWTCTIMKDHARPTHQKSWVLDQAAAAEAESTDREDVMQSMDMWWWNVFGENGRSSEKGVTRVIKGQVAQTCLILIFIDYFFFWWLIRNDVNDISVLSLVAIELPTCSRLHVSGCNAFSFMASAE